MRSRLFWRRSVAAAGTYSSAVLGFLGTVVALHVFSTRTFGLYALVLKVGGGVVATLALLALAPASHAILHKSGLATPLAIAAFIPLAQCTENVGGVALILRERYDIRALFLTLSMTLRFIAIVVGTQYGLTETFVGIVVAQAVTTAAIGVAGWIAFHRFP